MAIGSRRIVIIQGHPDPEGGHFCHALAAAYEHGAREKGHSVEVIDVARMEVPFIRSRTDHAQGAVPEPIRLAQLALLRADHLVIVHPVWNGGARPVRETPIGLVEAPEGSRRQRWTLEMARLGGEAG